SSSDKPRNPKRYNNFIERTISGIAHQLEHTFYAEALAKSDGLLQRIDPRVKVVGLFLLIIDVALSQRIAAISAILFIALILAAASRVPLRVLALQVWLGVLFFTGLAALPSIFITPGELFYRLPFVNLPITVQGLRSATFLLLRVETAATI